MSETARKPRSDSALKLLPEDQQERIWDWLNKPDTTLADVAATCWNDLGVRTSRTALSEFRAWFELKRRMAARDNRVGQVLEDLRRADPSISAEKLREYGSALFMSEALAAGDPKAFVAVGQLELSAKDLAARVAGFKAKFEQKERQLKLDKEKFVHQVKTTTEKALAAFYEEIKGNVAALAAFEKLQVAVGAALSEK